MRRLLEYQKYKAAAEDLGSRDTLGSAVFPRGQGEPRPEGPAPFAAFNIVDLLDAFSKVLERTGTKVEHEVIFDRISITDRIVELTDLLKSRGSVPFEEIFVRENRAPAKFDVVAFVWVAFGFLLLYRPTYWDLAHSIWASDEQGHGPIILAVSAWLLFEKRHELAELDSRPSIWLGSAVLGCGLLSSSRSIRCRCGSTVTIASNRPARKRPTTRWLTASPGVKAMSWRM